MFRVGIFGVDLFLFISKFVLVQESKTVCTCDSSKRTIFFVNAHADFIISKNPISSICIFFVFSVDLLW